VKRVGSICLATILLFGCSSKYIGTRNEQPHKKEIIKSKVSLEKNVNGTTINCKLVNHQNILEYYNKITEYKRDATISATAFILTGLIGAIYALSMEGPKEPFEPVYVPVSTPEDQIHNDLLRAEYEKNYSIYLNDKESFDKKRTFITKLSGGSLAVGITIPLIWRGKYSKKEGVSKESSNIISISTTPVEAYLDGILYQNMQTDEYGNFSFDLIPFVGKKQSINLIFNFPQHNKFSDTLIIPDTYMAQLYKEKMQKEEEIEKEIEELKEDIEREKTLKEKLLVVKLNSFNDIKNNATNVSNLLSYEFKDKIEAIFKYDVIKYFGLEEYDTPLKIKYYKNTQDYKNKLAVLKEIVVNKGNKYYYTTYHYNFPQYDIKRRGFYFYLSRNYSYYGGGFPEFEKTVGEIYFKNLSTYKRTGKSGLIYDEYIYVPMNEESGLNVENNINDTKLYFVFTVDGVINKTLTYFYDNKRLTNKNKFVQAGRVRVLIANNKTNEIYYDKTYGI